MRSRNRFYQPLLLICALLLTPYCSFANHGIEALGKTIEGLIKFYATVSFISFLLVLINLRRRSVWLRLLNILVLIPAAMAVIFMFGTPWGFFLLFWLILNIVLIIKSRRKTSGD